MLYCKISITSFIINRKNAILFYYKRTIGTPTYIIRNYTYKGMLQAYLFIVRSYFTTMSCMIQTNSPVNYSDNNGLLIKINMLLIKIIIKIYWSLFKFVRSVITIIKLHTL